MTPPKLWMFLPVRLYGCLFAVLRYRRDRHDPDAEYSICRSYSGLRLCSRKSRRPLYKLAQPGPNLPSLGGRALPVRPFECRARELDQIGYSPKTCLCPSATGPRKHSPPFVATTSISLVQCSSMIEAGSVRSVHRRLCHPTLAILNL